MRNTRANVALTCSAGLAMSASAVGQVTNGGFESGNLTGWTTTASVPAPTVTTAAPHSGTYCALLGTASGTSEPNGDSAFFQPINVSASGQAVTFWYKTATTDTIAYDWQDVYVQNSGG